MAIPDSVLETFSEQDLMHVANAKTLDDALPKLSDKALSQIANYKAPEAVSGADAFRIGAEKGLTFGARPAVAGAGQAIGGALGVLTGDAIESEPLFDKLKRAGSTAKRYYSEGRQEAIGEQKRAEAQRPGASLVGNLAGSALTLPFTAVRGVKGAIGLGAASGAGQAIGEAQDVNEAIGMVGTGAAVGGAVSGLSKALPWAASKAGDLGKKVQVKFGSMRTGIDEKVIQTWQNRAAEVKKLIRDSGGEITTAADNLRAETTRQIQSARQSLGREISESLKQSGGNAQLVNAKSVLEAVEGRLSQINPITQRARPDEINELKNIRDLIKSTMDEKGDIFVSDLHVLKEELQEMAKKAYQPGSFFVPGGLADNAAKSAAAEARRLVNREAPQIAKANNQLALLHRIEKDINKNLLKEGKSEAALLAAGRGSGVRNLKNLQRIESITGPGPVRGAENLAAMQAFSGYGLAPISSGGTTSTSRTLGGLAAGTALGLPPGVGQAIGYGLTTPASLKLEMAATKLAGKIGGAAGRAALTPSAQSLSIMQGSGAMNSRLQELKNQKNR